MAEYPDKKTVNIPVAMSDVTKSKITKFADSENLSNSEFVHNLIDEFLTKKVTEAMLLNDIFGHKLFEK